HWSHVQNQRWLNRDLRVLFKEVAHDGQYVVGHSDQNHTVLVPKEQVKEMGLHRVRVDTATPHTLYGTVQGHETLTIPLMMAS
ncbi:MAG TPA: tRNA (N6-isopentenyl adenosine(37)-C2)-methylthiotransferase MiaB, partial [Trueperaceae bacterium]